MTSAYTIYDDKSNLYSTPQFLENDDVARRAFQACITPGSLFESFPEDFRLLYIGEFDPEHGNLINAAERRLIAYATDFVKVNENGED